jgi:hypothetical protein
MYGSSHKAIFLHPSFLMRCQLQISAAGQLTTVKKRPPGAPGNILLAAVYKSPGRARIDEDISELLSFTKKCIMAGDLNAKHRFWNSRFSNPSGERLLNMFDLDDFEISAPQCPTHYSPAGNGMYWILWSIGISDLQIT